MKDLAKISYEQLMVKEIPLSEYYELYLKPILQKNGHRVGTLDEGHTSIVCPIHDDSTPSFKWYAETNTFNCFGNCGVTISGHHKNTAGNIVDLHIISEKAYKGREINRRTAYTEICKIMDRADLLAELPQNAGRGTFYAEITDVKHNRIEKHTYNFDKETKNKGSFMRQTEAKYGSDAEPKKMSLHEFSERQEVICNRLKEVKGKAISYEMHRLTLLDIEMGLQAKSKGYAGGGTTSSNEALSDSAMKSLMAELSFSKRKMY